MKYELKNLFNRKSNLLLLLAVISFLLTAGGYLYYSSETEPIRKIKHHELESIAAMKVEQISEWYTEELNDALLISRDVFLIENAQNYLDSKTEQNLSRLKKYLQTIAGQHSYDDIILTSTSSIPIVSALELKTIPGTEFKNMVREAVKTRSVSCLDIYRSPEEKKTFIDMAAPVINENDKIICVIIFRINVQNHLYPMIQNWPAYSKSSETFIFRQEDDSLRILSDLKYLDNTELDVKFAIDNQQYPSARAVSGYTGIFEGISYHKDEVLARLAYIPGTPWYMVAQVNRREVYADIRYRATIIILFTTGLIVLFGAGLKSIYDNRQKKVYVELFNREKELWTSQEKFKLSLDSIGEGVITADINGRIEYMNRIAEDLTEWNIKDAFGRTLEEVYHIKNESTGISENNIYNKILSEGIVKELANHTLLVSRTGKEIPVKDTGAPIHDMNGNVTGVVLVFGDEIEKRKQKRILEENENRLRSTLDNMLEGCQIISRDMKYVYVNDAAAKQGKRPKEELIGKTMMECYPGIEKTEIFSLFHKCLSEQTNALTENVFIYPDGTTGWFELSVQCVKEGLFILSQDISERKIAEKELIKAKEQAEEMNRIKSNFFSNMSHEMRTPLVAILGFSDLMMEQLSENNHLYQMAGYIKSGGERLLETLNLVLNISHIETQRTEVKLTEKNIIDLLKEITGLYSTEAFRKNIYYKLTVDEENVICSVDEQLFRNIFNNLLHNAFKYTFEGSVIVQTVTAEDKILIKVIDSGIGIPADKQELIWNEFRQASEGLDRKYQGTGLGLTIAKKYTELIGGHISLESNEGKGTVFIVELPVIKIIRQNILVT